jgi:transcriptional regulator with XRE-family HTH domain
MDEFSFIRAELRALVQWFLKNDYTREDLALALNVEIEELRRWFSNNTLPPAEYRKKIYDLTGLEVFQNLSGREATVGKPNGSDEESIRTNSCTTVIDCPAEEPIDGTEFDNAAPAREAESKISTQETNHRHDTAALPPALIKLNAWMKENHISRHRLAQMLDTHKSTVYRWYYRRTTPRTKEYLVKLYEMTGIEEFNVKNKRSPQSYNKVVESTDTQLIAPEGKKGPVGTLTDTQPEIDFVPAGETGWSANWD